MSLTSPPSVTVSGDVEAGEIEPMLAAIRQAVADAGEAGSALAELSDSQVIVVEPDESPQSVDSKIKTAMGRTRGLCLLIIEGGGKNPDVAAPGPLLTVTLEMQLYASRAIRGRNARNPLQHVVELARLLHHARLEVGGVPWYEELKFISFDPLEDPEFTAYALTFEREMQL